MLVGGSGGDGLGGLRPLPSSAPQPAPGGPTKPRLGMPPAHRALPAASPLTLRPLRAPAWRASTGPAPTLQRPPALVSSPTPPPTPAPGTGVGWEWDQERESLEGNTGQLGLSLEGNKGQLVCICSDFFLLCPCFSSPPPSPTSPTSFLSRPICLLCFPLLSVSSLRAVLPPLPPSFPNHPRPTTPVFGALPCPAHALPSAPVGPSGAVV